MEYLVTMTTQVPDGTSGEAVEDIRACEAARSLGLWRADDSAAMQATLASLPLDAWMSVQTTPLGPYPSDPALTGNQGI